MISKIFILCAYIVYNSKETNLIQIITSLWATELIKITLYVGTYAIINHSEG